MRRRTRRRISLRQAPHQPVPRGGQRTADLRLGKVGVQEMAGDGKRLGDPAA